jgi:hypothetical protein
MVANVNKLPEAYVPFPELRVCSNLMKSGTAPFVFGENIPLLLGKNVYPRVWISVPTDAAASTWADLLVGGTSWHEEMKLFLSEDQRELSIQFRRVPILEVKIVSEDSAEIPFIDFRTIGLNIVGDREGLNIGPQRLVNNTFENVAFMMRLG